MQKVIVADKIFTGTEWLHKHGVIIKDNVIEAVLSSEQVPSDAIFYEDAFLAPAFIDVQVYGAAKRLFATSPNAESLQVIQNEFVEEGTCLFQPTAATNTVDVFKKCIDAVRDYWQKGGKGVHGLHLEGPWLNQEKRGAHVKEWIHSPGIEEVRDILEYGKGVITMITLAPEVCSDDVLELIHSYNIIISAGHSNATYDEAVAGFEKGISAVTHLYNAMSPLQHRAPGLVGATLNHSSVTASIIPDGYHVDFSAVQIAKKIMGDRLFAITDAVTEAATGPYQHQLAGDKYECNGTLSGSALSMYQAFLNLVNGAGIEVDEALRMCSLYPAKALRCDNKYGKIVPQAAGQLIVLDTKVNLIDVIT